MASAPTLAKASFAVKSILFASDFSFASDAAASFVRMLASAYGSTVYAVNVLPYNEAGDWDDAAWRWQFARVNLQTFMENHRLRQFPHRILIGTGEVAERLTRFARDLSADLVVVGTHGRTGVNKFVIGSIAEQVIRTSTAPVMTVGPHVKPRTDATAGFHRVLVATDFTASCARALNCAAAIAEDNGARLLVVHAVDEVGLAIAGYVEEVLPQAERRVRKWVKAQITTLGVPWVAVARFGHAADVILQAGTEHNADLIVMGARRSEHPSLVAHSIAATAYKVVATANCPVLTVRNSEKRDDHENQ